MRLLCVVVFVIACNVSATSAQDSTIDSGVRVAMKIYDDCKKSEGFSPCLKKKAITFVDRLSRMEKLTLADGVTLLRAADAKTGPTLTEEQLDATLPRALEDKDEALTNIVMDKVSNFISSRSLDISMPRLIEEDEEYEYDTGRDGKIKIPKIKKKGKKKGMMGGLLMMIVGKLVALIPVAIAGLFLLAGKALITAKIALLLSGIIAIKKLVAAKRNGGGGGWQSGGHEVHDVQLGGGHGGGWQSGGGGGGGGGWNSGGGWDKRSLNEGPNLAYNAYKP